MSNAPQQFIYTEDLYRLPPRTLVLIPVLWETLGDEDKTLMGKILGAVRLSTAAVQIITRDKVDLQQLRAFNPSVIISFGVPVTPASQLYTANTLEGIRIIQSEALNVLTDATKKSLWGALKVTFA